MTAELRLPDLGEGVEEAQVLEWKVAPGQSVSAFDPLCDVESAKAAVELTSPVTGRVREIFVPAGSTARKGELLVSFDESTAGPDAEPAPEPEPEPEPEYFGIVGTPPKLPTGVLQPPVPLTALTPARRVLAAPLVRKLARERGVALEQVAGSGPGGRVRLADLDAYSQERFRPPDPAAQATSGQSGSRPSTDAQDTRIPLSGLRLRIAEHLTEAVRHAPLVSSHYLLDATELVRARALLAPDAEAEGTHLTYLPFVIKAVVQALMARPEVNAIVDEANLTIVRKGTYHIGFATAVPDGLVVPVLHDADQLSLLEIAAEIERLVDRARSGQFSPADVSGGSFTISSYGGLPGGPLFATPIPNHPEVAILGIGRVEPQPRVVDGQVVARDCLGVSLTFDHRVLDGEGAGAFMAEVRRFLEDPLRMLLRAH